MIVLDVSAAVDWLLQTSAGQRIENRIYSRNETLHTPHLLDLEVTQVLRRLLLHGVVPAHRVDEAVPRSAGSPNQSVSSLRASTQDLATA
jgi:predicted nucleic acid-binding protein